MNWVKEKIDYLKNRRQSDLDIEREHEKALQRIRNFQHVGNQFVYVISYLTDQLIYVSEEVSEILGYQPFVRFRRSAGVYIRFTNSSYSPTASAAGKENEERNCNSSFHSPADIDLAMEDRNLGSVSRIFSSIME